MKLHRKLVCILLPVLLFSACSPGGNSSSGGEESRVPPVQSSSASSEALESAAPEFDGVDFAARYRQAKQRLAEGEKTSQPVPQDPKETGFAVVSLDERVYGISQYAFLPLGERSLTEEEFLQLAQAMEGVPEWGILTPKYCRTGLMEGNGTAAAGQNRELTREEKLRYGALRPLYLYEGKRAEERTGQEAPLCVELSGEESGEIYRILPAASMTDEQLLRYLETEFREVPPEMYQPLVGEVSYQELPAVIEAAVTRYKLGDGTTPDYRAELITSGTETRNTDREYWGIELCFPEGDQYTLCLYAADGNLTSWIRWPPGYFDDPDFSGIRQLPEGGPRSEEEVLEAAVAYLRQIEPGEWEVTDCTVSESQGAVGQFYGSASEAEIKTSTGVRFNITVLNSDLSICNFIVRNGKA